jgi:hypothetical protein
MSNKLLKMLKTLVTHVGRLSHLLIVVQSVVAMYVPFLFELCWSPLCGDPEQYPFLFLPLLCRGGYRDVFSNG